MKTCFTGRIHSAVISGVNPEAKSVTVEWFERGETKGKEVCIFTCIFSAPARILGQRGAR